MTTPPAIRRGAARLDLMDPAVLAQLGGIELVARQVVEGFLMGLHRSPHRGFSAEFAELKAYQPGDDVRYVDWRMYGRSDRYFVKQFEEETNLRAYLLLDISSSMGWSSDPAGLPTKLWYARHLAGALGFILLRQGDRVGFAAFHDRIERRLEPRGGRRQWHELATELTHLEPGGGTSAHGALRDIAVRLRRRGLVILISDLLVDPAETTLALRFLRHHGHEVLVFHLMDPGEQDLPATGNVRFYDPETMEEMQVSVASLREEYRDSVARALEEWRRNLRPHRIDYMVLCTDQPFSRALRTYLHKRERLG
jgi:uncharacterized protein (DUF58 family)